MVCPGQIGAVPLLESLKEQSSASAHVPPVITRPRPPTPHKYQATVSYKFVTRNEVRCAWRTPGVLGIMPGASPS